MIKNLWGIMNLNYWLRWRKEWETCLKDWIELLLPNCKCLLWYLQDVAKVEILVRFGHFWVKLLKNWIFNIKFLQIRLLSFIRNIRKLKGLPLDHVLAIVVIKQLWDHHFRGEKDKNKLEKSIHLTFRFLELVKRIGKHWKIYIIISQNKKNN